MSRTHNEICQTAGATVERSHNSPAFPIAGGCPNENQRAAIELLILGRKTGEVATAIGIDRKTLYNWRHEKIFREELNRRRAELWSSAGQRLAAMVHPSLDVLEAHLGDRYEGNRFRAASAVLRLVDLKKISHQQQCES
jgi:hypothetical protein